MWESASTVTGKTMIGISKNNEVCANDGNNERSCEFLARLYLAQMVTHALWLGVKFADRKKKCLLRWKGAI